jgi:two-component system, NarL family, nitrate/nitrite response regulator NarL
MTKIFLADDHPMIQAALETLLRDDGQQIVGTATNGADALDGIAGSDADVIVLDIQMPGGSGLHVLSELRSRNDPRPVILLTAAISDDAIRKAIALGVRGIVLKTADPALLIEALAAVTQGGTWFDPEVRDTIDAAPDHKGGRPLSLRELKLIDLVRQGLKNRDIARRLNTTEGTVKAYLHALFDKLGVENRTELAMKAGTFLEGREA